VSETRAPACPVPDPFPAVVQLAHGGGGRLMRQLLDRLIVPAFRNRHLDAQHDAAVLAVGGIRIAFTTDSYVVRPAFFPGGDIGTLAVNGTVNDLAMSGARPVWLSAAFILEEGFPIESLRTVLDSMRAAALAAGAEIVTGDTKVVDHGKGDGIFINTAGIGLVEHSLEIVPASVRAGDAVLLSGDIGRHGIAIMAAREGLGFQTEILSDTAPLDGPVAALLAAGVDVHCLRDLTRGGLASAVIEIAEAANVAIGLEERAIPVDPVIRGACELLGLDPMYVANEGRFVTFVSEHDGDRALAALRAHPGAAGACRIGTVQGARPGHVTLRTAIGTSRLVEMFSGEQLPRIC
jgi:hydrogenase expression/formation protein HypE